MKEIHLPVKVHSCRIQLKTVLYENLRREERYIEVKKMKKVKDFGAPLKLGEEFIIQEREEIDHVYYLRLPKSCRCRKWVSNYEADQYVANGKGMRTFKLLARGLVRDENSIWIDVVRNRVPRVDLISRSDIERAYSGSERKSKHFHFNKITKKYEVVRTIPEGMTLADWLKDGEDEVLFERRIRKQYRDYIDNVHDLYMGFREKLIVPFRVDPFEGRSLFSFSKDMRTKGGHS